MEKVSKKRWNCPKKIESIKRETSSPELVHNKLAHLQSEFRRNTISRREEITKILKNGAWGFLYVSVGNARQKHLNISEMHDKDNYSSQEGGRCIDHKLPTKFQPQAQGLKNSEKIKNCQGLIRNQNVHFLMWEIIKYYKSKPKSL